MNPTQNTLDEVCPFTASQLLLNLGILAFVLVTNLGNVVDPQTHRAAMRNLSRVHR
jgi:hypothetical protein